MGSALPRVDASTGWPVHTCGTRHDGNVCPPVGVWLVLNLCNHCNPRTGHYCSGHRGRP